MQNKANQTGQNASDNRSEAIRKDLPEEICSIWLGWRDSNPRMLEPEPSALPLGDIPLPIVMIASLSDRFKYASLYIDKNKLY